MIKFSYQTIIFTLLFVAGTDAQVIHIAYTGNLNGVLEACYCDGQNRGGILQVKSAIDTLRSRYPDLILLDSGDFLKSFPLTESNELMFEFIHQMQYSVLGLGEQEWVEGTNFFVTQLNQFPLPMVCSNLVGDNSLPVNILPYKIIQRDNLQIGILSILFPHCFDYIKMAEYQLLDAVQVLQNLIPILKNETDLIILLCHESYRIAEVLAEKFPEIQIIISGHSQEKAEILTDRQIILQAGYDGEILGLLTVEKINGQFKFQNQFLEVDSSYGVYPPFQKKVIQFYRQYDHNPKD